MNIPAPGPPQPKVRPRFTLADATILELIAMEQYRLSDTEAAKEGSEYTYAGVRLREVARKIRSRI